jgi:putative NADPH-quinone reductase
MARILIINGHPDPRPERLCAALAEAYAGGAEGVGHATRRLDVGALRFPLIRSAEAFEGAVPAGIAEAQEAVRWAEHLVLVFPLWLGGMPALLKGFLEQLLRYGFSLPKQSEGFPKGLLGGRSARIIVTMGMPGPVYRWWFGAHGVRTLEREILGLSGIRPVRHTLIGGVGTSAAQDRWLLRVAALGAQGR